MDYHRVNRHKEMLPGQHPKESFLVRQSPAISVFSLFCRESTAKHYCFLSLLKLITMQSIHGKKKKISQDLRASEKKVFLFLLYFNDLYGVYMMWDVAKFYI